jgi:hypothetical protein
MQITRFFSMFELPERLMNIYETFQTTLSDRYEPVDGPWFTVSRVVLLQASGSHLDEIKDAEFLLDRDTEPRDKAVVLRSVTETALNMEVGALFEYKTTLGLLFLE